MELQMFLAPSMATLSIAATRIHRDLIDYVSVECTEQYGITLSHSSQRSLLTVVDMVGATRLASEKVAASGGKAIQHPSSWFHRAPLR